jgi:outer membrane protein insertion porin family
VIPDTEPGSAEDLIDLIITVEERSTLDIQFGISVSADAEKDPFLGMIN